MVMPPKSWEQQVTEWFNEDENHKSPDLSSAPLGHFVPSSKQLTREFLV